MPICEIYGVKITGLASAVPQAIRTISDDAKLFGEQEAKKIADRIGVTSRHIVANDMCTSDLCFAAAQILLDKIRWSRETIDVLIFVSQTPDFLLPATSCLLQHRLGLSKRCAAFDVNLGCSGYVYGLWLISQLLQNNYLKRGLLLVGDTISRIVSSQDRSTVHLFGDAGTATALEVSDPSTKMVYDLGTDGSGQDHLIVPAGAFRQPRSDSTCRRTKREGHNIRSDEDLFMDGAEVFTFTLREVPSIIKSVLRSTDWSIDTVDAYVMHQANRFMLQYLAKKMRIPPDKMIMSLENFGNTSSASIPLTMTVELADQLASGSLNLILAGFGVGFSWAAVSLTGGPMMIPNLLIVD